MVALFRPLVLDLVLPWPRHLCILFDDDGDIDGASDWLALFLRVRHFMILGLREARVWAAVDKVGAWPRCFLSLGGGQVHRASR